MKGPFVLWLRSCSWCLPHRLYCVQKLYKAVNPPVFLSCTAEPALTLLYRNFQPRVSFDTFDKPADFIEESSFTLIAKHKDYEYTKRSRTFLCGFDENEYSTYALQWLINELVDDGDEIVCLRVVEKEDTIAGDRSVETGRYKREADATMQDIQSRNHENKAINLILEFSVGKVNKVIDDMVCFFSFRR
jgi:hypothetical protein